jgi:predicted acetyltransferase
MVTSISTLRHSISFGGTAIDAGEVHMVGSLPEHRGVGGVRSLMGQILRDFRDRGDALAVNNVETLGRVFVRRPIYLAL